jgi:glucose-1-phosphate thymidylyltransferase
MRTIILAGGFATRLYPLTLERPKPLLPVAGRPIIDHILQGNALPGTPIVSTNRRFEAAFEAWKQGADVDVEIVIEETLCEKEKLGTVGAIAFVIEACALDDDLLVIAGDNIFGFPIDRFVAAYRGHPLIALHDIGDLDKVRSRYGVAVVKDGRVAEFQEKPRDPRSTLVSTACYVYPRSVLSEFKAYFDQAGAGQDAPGYFNAWLLRERGIPIDPFVFDEAWYDIGDRASYIAAHREQTGQDSWIAESATVEGCEITDSVILDGSRVTSSRLRGCVIGENCDLSGVDLCDGLIGDASRIAVAR